MSMKLTPIVILAALGAACGLVVRSPSEPPNLPNFDRVVFLETTSETSANVSLGDLNGDGHLDIVLAKGRHWPLVNRVLLGNGRGQFPEAYDLAPTSDRSYSGSLADLDGDGDLDVVISNDAPDPKQVYLNDGRGHFRKGATYGSPLWSTRNADVADIDRDGLPDIIVANRSGNEPGASFVCLNRGGGVFDDECIAFARESATTITAADFDGDGRVDLAVPYRDGGQSYVYLNGPEGNLETLRRIPFGPNDAAIRMARAVDLDGDGLLDLVTIEQQRGVTAYFGRAGPRFSPGLRIAGPAVTPYALAVGDLNLDGAPDILVGNVEAPSVVYINDRLGRGFTPVEFGDDQGTVYGFAIGDVDEDGWPDIAAARSGARNAVYFAAFAL